MANDLEKQACSFVGTTIAQLLARGLSSAGGAAWQVALAEPPSATLPSPNSPVYYCLRFAERLNGSCYVVFSQTDLEILVSGDQAARGEDAEAAADAEALVPAPSAVLLEKMRALGESLPAELAATYGAVSVVVEQVEALDPQALHALELQANGAPGQSAVILLYFDPELLQSLEPPAAQSPASSEDNNIAAKANLGLVMDVELSCTLRFGQRQLTLREILDLASGSVVELDRQVDEPVELILDGRVIARGEAVIVDGNYGLRVTQVLHQVAF